MEYAIQLLLPILGGLLLGNWLHQTYGVSEMWTLVLAVLGMLAGLGILYKRIAHPELYGGQPPKIFKKKRPEDENRKNFKELDFMYREDDWDDQDDDRNYEQFDRDDK